jgi:hypothetical protein
MPSYVLTDGTNVVSLNPYYDIMQGGGKIQDNHRTLSGAKYVYKWGTFDRVVMNVDYLSSADMTRVNSWYGANTPLRLFDINSTVVVSAYIANADKPIANYVAPYTDMFMGTIELESY